MSKFDNAVKEIFLDEGGFIIDHAGPTNYGVTLGFLKKQNAIDPDINGDGFIDEKDIREMTTGQAKVIYHKEWWEKYGYENIENQEIANKVFSLSINMGPSTAHIVAQRALRASGYRVKEDGIIGQKTILAINNVTPRLLLCCIRAEAAGYYRYLIAKKPAFKIYENGWLNRAYK